mmetsp:Transcript_38921/g.124916  ORF Transcript_38921/g.124916 Transcript_38921/m.124916 type:complete len:430 (-) Transcript_38921:1309-2598(-)
MARATSTGATISSAFLAWPYHAQARTPQADGSQRRTTARLQKRYIPEDEHQVRMDMCFLSAGLGSFKPATCAHALLGTRRFFTTCSHRLRVTTASPRCPWLRRYEAAPAAKRPETRARPPPLRRHLLCRAKPAPRPGRRRQRRLLRRLLRRCQANLVPANPIPCSGSLALRPSPQANSSGSQPHCRRRRATWGPPKQPPPGASRAPWTARVPKQVCRRAKSPPEPLGLPSVPANRPSWATTWRWPPPAAASRPWSRTPAAALRPRSPVSRRCHRRCRRRLTRTRSWPSSPAAGASSASPQAPAKQSARAAAVAQLAVPTLLHEDALLRPTTRLVWLASRWQTAGVETARRRPWRAPGRASLTQGSTAASPGPRTSRSARAPAMRPGARGTAARRASWRRRGWRPWCQLQVPSESRPGPVSPDALARVPN